MLQGLKKSLGLDHNEKQLKGIKPLVKRVNEEQEKLKKEHENDADEEFIRFVQQKTAEYKKTIQEKLQKVKEENKDVLGEGYVDQIKEFNKKVQIERQKILDEILPEAYALVRETSKRTLKASDGQPMEPFDVQVMGGIALHWGRITEMATGEGKTLVATLPAYLNALTGEGVHIVTVNEYLAQRDARWMAPLYNALGVSVGVNLSKSGYELYGSEILLDPEIEELMRQRDKLQEELKKTESKESIDKAIKEINRKISEKRPHKPEDDELKKESYTRDITYGTNSEFGFDYLRDNMKMSLEAKVQRGHHFAIVDEVDSILIDESKVPLIISNPVDHIPISQYADMNPKIKEIVEKQKEIIDKKSKQVEKLLETYKNSLEENKKYDINELRDEIGYLLLQIKKGNPKNELIVKELKIEPLLQKALKNKEYEDILNKTTLEDKDLFFIVNEEQNSVVFTEKGWYDIHGEKTEMPNFVDLDERLNEIEESELSPEEKEKEKQELEKDYRVLDSLNAAEKLLKAHTLFEKDVDYIVEDGQVFIIDKQTGRKQIGKRYSEGVHEAVEAKEGLEVQAASQTWATISYQNYFRMYPKLAGMTGTAETEKDEFLKIYNMDTIVIPTNKPLNRTEHDDIIYLTKKAKFKAVIQDIEEKHKQGRPILVGTASVEESERLSSLLSKEGIPHRVLNASRTTDKTKGKEMLSTEAEIVKQAGERGTVTISTNMAGRGTDIILGYNPGLLIQKMKKEAKTYPDKEKDYITKLLHELSQDPEFLEQHPEFKNEISDYEEALEKIAYYKAKKEKEEIVKLGGLHVIGVERHEARRIDNQLRGRAGRQGDPGSSIFYLSLDDNLLRMFSGDWMKKVFKKVGVKEDEPIEHKVITKVIQNAQKRIEDNHFAARKNLLNLDDTDDQLRSLIYRERDIILEGKNLKEYILSTAQDVLEKLVDEHTDGQKFPEEWGWEGLGGKFYQTFGIEIPKISREDTTLEALKEQLNDLMIKKYENRTTTILKNSKKMKLKTVKEHYKRAIKSLEKEGITEKERKIEQFKDDYKVIVSSIKAKYENPSLKIKIESFLNYQDKNTALSILDEKWVSLLSHLELLKEGVNLVGYGHKDPRVEYRKSSFDMFDDFIDDVKQGITRQIFSNIYQIRIG